MAWTSKVKSGAGKLAGFVRSVLSERDGSGSASRTIGLLVAAGAVLALLVYVIIRRDMPSGEQLGGLAKVIGLGSAAYGMNQVSKGASDVAAGGPPAAATAPDNPDGQAGAAGAS